MVGQKGVLNMKKKTNFLKDQRGAVLVIALIMMVVLTLIGIAGSFTSIFEIMISGHKRGSTNAFYSADSGVQVVVANIDNFNPTDTTKYVDNKYNPFTDPNNPNPTNASVTISYHHNGCRGIPVGTDFDCLHFMVESRGEDQIASGSNKSTANIQQKVVRVIPQPEEGS